MFARVSKFTGGSGDALDQQVSDFRSQNLATLQAAAGYKGVFFLADRDSGDGLAVTLWADEEALRASEEMADRVREETLQEGETIAGVDRYEVLLAEYAG